MGHLDGDERTTGAPEQTGFPSEPRERRLCSLLRVWGLRKGHPLFLPAKDSNGVCDLVDCVADERLRQVDECIASDFSLKASASTKVLRRPFPRRGILRRSPQCRRGVDVCFRCDDGASSKAPRSTGRGLPPARRTTRVGG
uniref:Uncharacterized protein n=1 Tax=Rhipicephalus zambeziensis TaxID=60191 RepID=A0A224Y8Q1_9ACAR